MLARFLLVALLLIPVHLLAGGETADADRYRVKYSVTFDPERRLAEVRLHIPDNPFVRRLKFNTGKLPVDLLSHNGTLERRDERLLWRPPEKDARLHYTVTIDHQRRPGAYDALIEDDWVIMRGDDLVPPVATLYRGKPRADAAVKFELPRGWSVNAAWSRQGETSFDLPREERAFVRPKGWLVAGRLTTRREQLGPTELAVSAPRGHNFRPMEKVALITLVWPHYQKLLPELPPALLITGGREPLWRGGLSGPNSLFIHSGRPLISENGTSTLVHELFHVLSGIRGTRGHDWIAEGLAEYYAVELLSRAGVYTDARMQEIWQGMREWGEQTETLVKRNSKGASTARAALLFSHLDDEIRSKSDGQFRLDDLVRRLDASTRISLADLKRAFERLVGEPSQVLQRDVLQTKKAS